MSEVPQPKVALPSAAKLVAQVRSKGGRVYRMRDGVGVFALMDDERLAGWLERKGARGIGAYERAPGGKTEWDLWINTIPVAEGQTVWEAAA